MIYSTGPVFPDSAARAMIRPMLGTIPSRRRRTSVLQSRTKQSAGYFRAASLHALVHLRIVGGETLQVTDVGRAMISGTCADIGKVKGPVLRGRAPYFQNGSAATLSDVVEFYDQRFSIRLTAQQKVDLVAFLDVL